MSDRSFLAWPFFADHHRRLADDIGEWAERVLAPALAAEHDDVEAAAIRYAAQLGEAGFLRYVVPKAYGGAHEALDVRSLCLIRETLARYSGIADVAFAMQGLGSGSISLAGSDLVKLRYLPKVATGKHIAAFAMTEPSGGSDVAAVQTTAREDGDAYVLDGAKTFISNAGIAHHYVVFARTAPTGAKGLTAFVVDADTKGLSVTEKLDLLAPHPIGTLEFKGCRVPKAQMLGRPGEGFKVGMATLDIFRTTVGAAALGFARRALDEGLDYADHRQAFGQNLSEFQLVQDKLAQMALDVDTSALLIYRSAWVKDAGAARVTREASMAKFHATEAAQRVVDAALQIHGGRGVVTGQAVERLYREVRALRIYEGASDIQKLVIANQILKDHRDAAGQAPAGAQAKKP